MTTSYKIKAREETRKLKKLRREAEAALANKKENESLVKPEPLVTENSQEKLTDPTFVTPDVKAKPKAKPKAKAKAKAQKESEDSDAS